MSKTTPATPAVDQRYLRLYSAVSWLLMHHRLKPGRDWHARVDEGEHGQVISVNLDGYYSMSPAEMDAMAQAWDRSIDEVIQALDDIDDKGARPPQVDHDWGQ